MKKFLFDLFPLILFSLASIGTPIFMRGHGRGDYCVHRPDTLAAPHRQGHRGHALDKPVGHRDFWRRHSCGCTATSSSSGSPPCCTGCSAARCWARGVPVRGATWSAACWASRSRCPIRSGERLNLELGAVLRGGRRGQPVCGLLRPLHRISMGQFQGLRPDGPAGRFRHRPVAVAGQSICRRRTHRSRSKRRLIKEIIPYICLKILNELRLFAHALLR